MTSVKATLEMAKAAKRSGAAQSLASRKQVNGIGIGMDADGYTLKVNLVAPLDGDVPDEIDGVPVSVDLVGPVYPA